MAVTAPDFFAASFAGALAFAFVSLASWAADGPRRSRPAARARASTIRLVRIDRPPVDEREPQPARRVERIAGVEQKIGGLARLDGTVRFIQPEERRGPFRECF